MRSATRACPCASSVDDRDLRGGDKVWQWIKKGVPLRLEIGPRDIEKDCVFVGRRDKRAEGQAAACRAASSSRRSPRSLQEIQDSLFARAQAYRKQHTRVIDTKDEFYAFFTDRRRSTENAPTPIHAGFALTHFSGDAGPRSKIKDDLEVTVRCIPLETGEPGTCPFTGQPSKQRVVWAKSY